MLVHGVHASGRSINPAGLSQSRGVQACGQDAAILEFIIEDACGGSSPHPQATPPSNMRVLCEHLHVPKARQVEFKANCIYFRCELYLLGKTQAATNAEIHETNNARLFCF